MTTQVCDICLPPSDDPSADKTKMHGESNANDGDISTWWQVSRLQTKLQGLIPCFQSPPISRGRKYNRVDLEIDLLQSFQVI